MPDADDLAAPGDLDADAAAYLRGLPAPPAGPPSVTRLRSAYAAATAVVCRPGEPVDDVHDGEVAGVPVRTYAPAGARGTTVWLHGGGWVVGSLDSHDALCRALALRAGCTVVAVDYGLAPELRHPGQLRQVLGVVGALGDGPLALAGDSAGGHLAALAATRTGRPLAGLALVYPVVSPRLDTPSARDNGSGLGLTTGAMRWYWEQFLPAGAPAQEPADLLETDLARLPPTLVLTAGHDPLRDEGRALADAVERAGVPVQRLSYDRQVHGFFRMSRVIGQSREAELQVGRFLASVLG